MRFLFAIIILFQFFCIRGQITTDLPATNSPINFTPNQILSFDNRYEGIRGTHTFFENYVLGSVRLKDDKTYEQIYINYDAASDNLIAKSEKSGRGFIVRKDIVLEFLMKDQTIEYLFVKKVLNEAPVFLLELAKKDIAFYCKTVKLIKEASIGGAFNSFSNNYDEFFSNNTYYIERHGQLNELPMSKTGLRKFFPALDSELKSYFRTNRIDFDNLNDVRRLFEFIFEQQ